MRPHLPPRPSPRCSLKPANILVSGGTLKVADFGLARTKPATPTCLTAETGSYRWMAPEVMRHEPYDERCDVYSFALVSWELLTLEMPFARMQGLDVTAASTRTETAVGPHVAYPS